MKHVLVVDDDDLVRKTIETALTSAGFEVMAAATAAEALKLAESRHFDLATIDVVLPDGDGLNLTRTLRDRYGIGIVMISGLGGTTERVVGLEVGADDYMSKPFSPRELVARVRSVLRRLEARVAQAQSIGGEREAFVFDGWRLDLAARELRDPDGRLVPLTSGEYKLLETFVTRPNRVLSREQLLDLVCTNDMPAFDRSIDVRIGRLRKKLGSEPESRNLIKTIRNGGYLFATKVATVRA
jgi:two-component system OmpR family response regulator